VRGLLLLDERNTGKLGTERVTREVPRGDKSQKSSLELIYVRIQMQKNAKRKRGRVKPMSQKRKKPNYTGLSKGMFELEHKNK